jgi:hypothetical protein
VRTVTLERGHAGSSLITLTAWGMITGALLQIVLGVPLAPLQAQEPVLWPIAALNAVSHLLLIVGVAGLTQSGATERGRLAAVGLGLTLLGLAELIVAEAVWAIAGEEAAVLLYSTATLAIMLGLILTGIAVLRTGQWEGWRRFTVLAAGVFIPLILMPAFALPGYAPNFAIGIWGVCWLLIGLALRTEATRGDHGRTEQHRSSQ